MVTLGDEGMGLPGDTSYPYQYGEGTDWVGLLNITTLYVGPLNTVSGVVSVMLMIDCCLGTLERSTSILTHVSPPTIMRYHGKVTDGL